MLDDKLDLNLFTLIKDTFFTHSGIEAVEDITGLRIKDDGTLVLGCQAGPSREIVNLFHEMGHFILTPDNKLGLPAWGLDYKKYVHIPGYDPFPEVHTCNDVLLELDVIGWQAILEKHYTNYTEGSLDNIRALSWLQGWAYYQYDAVKLLPSYDDKERKRIEIGKEYIKDFVTKHTFQEFTQNWNEKIKVISKMKVVV